MAGDIIKVLLDGTSVPAKVKSHTIILKRSQSGRRFFNPKGEEVNERGYRPGRRAKSDKGSFNEAGNDPATP